MINNNPNEQLKDLAKIKYKWIISVYWQKLFINKIELLDDKNLCLCGQDEKLNLFGIYKLRIYLIKRVNQLNVVVLILILKKIFLKVFVIV